MRIALLLTLVAGCTGRPLGDGDDGGIADLAQLDRAQLDLARVDLTALVGVACAAEICDTTAGDVCCEDKLVCTAGACSSPGVQRTGCDGPEDCVSGLLCCLYVDPFFGTACAKTCDDPSQRGVICHTAADCKATQMCVQLEVSGNLMGCFP